FEPPSDHPLALKRQLLPHTRQEQATPDAVASVARTESVGRVEEVYVLAVRAQLVQHDDQVHIVLIDREVEHAAHLPCDVDSFIEGLRHEQRTLARLQIPQDQVARGPPFDVGAIPKIESL